MASIVRRKPKVIPIESPICSSESVPTVKSHPEDADHKNHLKTLTTLSAAIWPPPLGTPSLIPTHEFLSWPLK
ncbi:hypothetical protein J6590_041899 [Homalodisca vitripennis]|nr:hypothetical protein J6590_041899 [Homalodisca vitripennis]